MSASPIASAEKPEEQGPPSFHEETEAAFFTAPNSRAESRASTPATAVSPVERQTTESRKRKRGRQPAHPPRSQRLKSHYNDNYRQLFNVEVNDASSRFGEDHQLHAKELVEPSQIGASRWSSEEKNKFFTALSKLGKHAISGISAAVGSKSEMEVREYLLLLQRGFVNHNLHDARIQILGFSDLPAAVELTPECTKTLDLAAEALAWYQETYEAKQEKEKHGVMWLLTGEVAEDIEWCFENLKSPESGAPGNEANEEMHPDASEYDPKEHENPQDDSEGGLEENLEEILASIPAARLLNLRNWLHLSKQLFMNSSRSNLEDNWQSIADPGDEPSIYHTAFSDFYTLAVSITRRLVQASQFQAMSRLRAEDWRTAHGPKPSVRKWDVHTAVDVLGMKRNSKDFWKYTAQRCGVKVYENPPTMRSDHQHRKELSYEEVERRLTGGRRKKSHPHVSRDPLNASVPAASEQDEEVNYDNRSEASSEPESLYSEVEDSEAHATDEHESCPVDPKDDYAELWDQKASAAVEQSLWKLLQQEPAPEVKREETELPKRPVIVRRAREELIDWRDWTDYHPEWERFGEIVPASEFARIRKQLAEPSTESRPSKPSRSRRSSSESVEAATDDDVPDDEPQRPQSPPVRLAAPHADAIGSGGDADSAPQAAHSPTKRAAAKWPLVAPLTLSPPPRRVLQPRRAREVAATSIEATPFLPAAGDDSSADEFMADGEADDSG